MAKMKSLFLILLTILSQQSFADERGWLGVFSRKANQTNTHFTHQEVQIRYNFENGSNQQLLARFGILKPLNDKHEVGVIVGYIETGDLVEYRPAFQHLYSLKGVSQTFSFRSRIEWRDWQDRNTNSIRSRFQLSYLKPLTSTQSLLIWDEPFLNITHDKMSGERVFERNRFFVGLKFSGLGHVFDVGYMNQFIPRKTDTTEHIAVVYLYF